MLGSAKVALAFVAAAFLTFSTDVKAQTSNNPYHVDYDWDKIQGRKIGIASGFKMDPDGNIYSGGAGIKGMVHHPFRSVD